ncbi:hypothetical protein CDCA_CDCA01G0147 [Cyanidium caldarium]|uniref:Glycosyl hydrolase family 13 catalytic domain-containing protein n=1 Tax=Cyanidium caldarium TaxID=2771 RepID=A0AAV9IPD9_CYACA|nr:hypothetical protein CDCA_CDCA01G0147 [Cyanidium caldarium]
MGVVQSAPLAEEVDHRTGRRISRIASSASRLINSRKVPPEVPWLQAVSAGSEKPLGCSFLRDDVVNFAIYSTEAKHMTLIVYHPEHETEVAESMSQMAHIEDEQEGEDDGDGEEEPESSSESLTFEALDTCVELKLDPRVNRTGNVWHVAIQPALAMYRYAWRVGQGKKAQLVMDPYARLLSSPRCIDFGAREKRHNSYEPRAVIPPRDYLHGFDWQEVKSPDIPPSDWIVYEVHVRSFTALARDTAAPPGSYAAVIEKIPYLKSLGVNCVELLPVFEFNELEWERRNPNTGEDLCQYWGYSTVAFFAPMNRYSAVGCSGGAVGHSGRLSFQRRSLSLHRRRLRFRSVLDEFRTMVRELHRAGIKVILDVVFNHTAETWRIYHFRALANHDYYLHSEGKDVNFSGCGHTVACNRLVVVEFIRDSLKYWTEEMHVDGFRFDLAATLARSPSPPFAPMKYPTLMTALSRDPSLQHVLLIAEPWDIGAYLVGEFLRFGRNWTEWNGKFRDTVRRFIKGDQGTMEEMATRVCGSEDMYGAHVEEPAEPGAETDAYRPGAINFVTCHDGMSLRDLVSYNEAQNWANGEENRDGEKHNLSWNCGVEGETDDEGVLALRRRQQRNLLLALLLSAGIPMLKSGDEIGHTQQGSSNVWCQDNELNYLHWDEMGAETVTAAAEGKAELSEAQSLLRFVRTLIRFRKRVAPAFRRFLSAERGDIQWLGPDASAATLPPPGADEEEVLAAAGNGQLPAEAGVDWGTDANFLAYVLHGYRIPGLHGRSVYVAFNASHVERQVQPPRIASKAYGWVVLFNTSADPPGDCYTLSDEAEAGDDDVPASVTCVEPPVPMLPYSALVMVMHARTTGGEPVAVREGEEEKGGGEEEIGEEGETTHKTEAEQPREGAADVEPAEDQPGAEYPEQTQPPEGDPAAGDGGGSGSRNEEHAEGA